MLCNVITNANNNNKIQIVIQFKSPFLFSKVCLLKKRAVALELTHIHLVPTLCRALCKVLLGAVSSVVLVAQLCLIFCNFTDCSSPGSFVHGILQARTLE